MVHWLSHGITPAELDTPFGTNSPCSGFVTVDSTGAAAAGYRQCPSTGQHTVPLMIRVANDSTLDHWGPPIYLYNVTFNRILPYDPVRPWQGADGFWYSTVSLDACNNTVPCAGGGLASLYRSPKLHGPGTNWEHVGPLLSSNATVLEGEYETHEFVTPDYFGGLPGDPLGGKSRVFTNNVAGPGYTMVSANPHHDDSAALTCVCLLYSILRAPSAWKVPL